MSSVTLDSSQLNRPSAAAIEPRRTRRREIRSPAVAEASPLANEVALRNARQPSDTGARRRHEGPGGGRSPPLEKRGRVAQPPPAIGWGPAPKPMAPEREPVGGV